MNGMIGKGTGGAASRRGLAAVLGLAVLASAGCVAPSTPEGRIDRNRDYFDSLPVEVQARIRGGQTEIGFSAEETRLALGEPQQQWVRRTAEGTTEVWLYAETERSYERQHVDFIGVPDGRGNRLTGGGYVNALRERERPTARVEFRGGRVVAIETPAAGGR